MLWITLCNLIELFNTSHSVLFLVYFCTLIVNNVITIYFTIISFFMVSENTYYAGNLMASTLCMILTGFMCECADSTFRRVSTSAFYNIIVFLCDSWDEMEVWFGWIFKFDGKSVFDKYFRIDKIFKTHWVFKFKGKCQKLITFSLHICRSEEWVP